MLALRLVSRSVCPNVRALLELSFEALVFRTRLLSTALGREGRLSGSLTALGWVLSTSAAATGRQKARVCAYPSPFRSRKQLAPEWETPLRASAMLCDDGPRAGAAADELPSGM
jgi:hypothetical protein